MRSLNIPLLQALSDGLIVLDHELNVRFVNKAFEAITGIVATSAIGKNISKLGDADSAIRAGQLCLDVVLENRVVTTELVYAGQKTSVQIFPSADGCQLLLKKADSSVKEEDTDSTERLQALLESLPSSFAFIDKNYRVLAWSKRFKSYVEENTGKKLKTGSNVFDFMSDRDVPKLRARIDKALSGETVEAECTFHLPKTGREVWTRQHFHPVFGRGQQVTGMVYHGYDIDARKQAEQNSEDSYRRLKMVMMATNDAVWEWNLEDDALQWNENFYTLFGYAREDVELNLQWWDDNVHPDDHERVIGELNKVLDQKQARCQCDYRFRCRNGTYKYVRDSGYIEYDENGKPWRMVGSMQDIDYLKLQEQKLTQQNQTLHNLAFVQSHLIRKPAANIIALQNVMRSCLSEELKTNPDLQLLFKHMEESVAELDAMIHASVVKIHESGLDLKNP